MRTLSVIVVHPEGEVGEPIAESIREAGHTALVVPDGERAIDRFIQEPVDAMIVEMVLPGRDGGTTVESIRWAPGGEEVAVILLGTRGTPPERLDSVGRQVGALATLTGPPNTAAIQSLLAGVARPHASETRVAQSDEVDRFVAITREHMISPKAATAQNIAADVTAPNDWEEELYTDVDEELSGHWESGDDPNAEQEGAEVEQHALRLSQTQNGLHGDLASTPFPKLLHWLAERRATGALVISSERDARRTTTRESPKKIVYFRSGVPVYVRSNLIQECLGQVLARGGHISAHVLEESVHRMRAGEGRQGGVLVSMGILTPHELRESLEDQLRVKLFDLFAWSSGTFSFDEQASPPPETVTLEMSLADIVLKGVVHRVPPKRLLELLEPHIEQFVVPDPARLEQFRAVDMAPVARRLLMALDGTQLLRDLLGAAGNRPGAAAQLVYALHCVEAIGFSPETQPTPRLQERRRDTPAGADLQALREELGRLGRLLREERWEEALGVDAADPAEALRRSERLAARFRRVTEPGAAPRDMRALAYEVCARLVHAQKALAPAASLAGTAVGKRMAGPGGEEWADDEVPTKDEKQRRSSRGRVSLTSGRPTVPMDRREMTARVEGMLEHAEPHAMTDVEEEDTFEEGPDDIPTPKISEPPPISVESSLDSGERRVPVSSSVDIAPEALDERVDNLFRAERYFRRGEKALARRRIRDAVESFQKAVALCPEEGEFLAHLGYARYQAADGETHGVERAIDELERASRLAPKLDITHLLLARILHDLGQETEARNAYERALAANPDCDEALEGLRGLPGDRM